MMRMFAYTWLKWGLSVSLLAANIPPEEPIAQSQDSGGNARVSGPVQSPEEAGAVPFWRDPDRWSFQVGVGVITRATIGELASGQVGLARGDAAGQVYLLQASMKLAAFEPVLARRRMALDLELPLVLGVVDERGRDPFVQYSGGVTLRWKTFPWNRWLYTNVETGIGSTYSHHVVGIERQRHPDRDRSHLEFYWPLQLMFAHPRHPRHQLVLFNHHHSGGRVFHIGGANALGVGYRLVLGN